MNARLAQRESAALTRRSRGFDSSAGYVKNKMRRRGGTDAQTTWLLRAVRLVFAGIAIDVGSMAAAIAGYPILSADLRALAALTLLVLGVAIARRRWTANRRSVRRMGAYVVCIAAAVLIHTLFPGAWPLAVLVIGVIVPMLLTFVEANRILRSDNGARQ
jgi:FtsH-binding integral membrane protein